MKRRSVFDTIETLDSQDARNETKKRRIRETSLRNSKAAQSQVKLYRCLMEVRILLHRVLQSSENGQLSHDSADEAAQQLMHRLLSLLMNAQHKLVGTPAPSSASAPTITAREEQIQANYRDCKDVWLRVMNQRYKDLKLHAGLTAKAQFKLLDSDFWQQVESTVSYEMSTVRNNIQNEDKVEESSLFDDSKLYQHLLQDFLMTSNNNTMTSGSAGQTMSNSKGKPKKDVDRKASKGRKIRYQTIPKLVGFTFPVYRKEAVMDEEEWFQSLFGRAAAASPETSS